MTKTITVEATAKRCAELEQFLEDALAYMRWCARNNEPHNGQLLTLAHDMSGLFHQDRCFRPRVSGYATSEA